MMLQNIMIKLHNKLKLRIVYRNILNKQMSNYIDFDGVNLTKPLKTIQNKQSYLIPSNISNESLVSSIEIRGHLKWLASKYVLNQDVFLIGPSSSLRRKIAYLFCNLIEAETELLTITRDTVESDLRQRKEIINNGKSTYYSDSPVVKAAIHGRILILDGIEKAERNVLPTLNNLLENREMSLDDGRYLLPAHKYDALVNELGLDECRRRGLERVSIDFKVLALGLPIPPYIGHALDPPLRSRFQGRVIETPDTFNHINSSTNHSNSNKTDNTDLKRNILSSDVINGINKQLQSFHDITKGDNIPHLPYDSMLRLQNILYHRIYSHSLHVEQQPLNDKNNEIKLLDCQTIQRYYPYHLFDNEISKQVEVAFKHIGIIPSNDNDLHITNKYNSKLSPDGHYVETPSVQDTVRSMEEDWLLGHDICIVGAAGSGKSAFVTHFLKTKLNIDSTADNIESIFLYQDLSARDLIEQRTTDINGNTIWQPSPVIRAVVEGKILILDGIDRLSIDALCILAPLLQDRRLPIYGSNILLTPSTIDTTDDAYYHTTATTTTNDISIASIKSEYMPKPMEIISIHPNFRVIALASPPTVSNPWMCEEVFALFAFHTIKEVDHSIILETLFPKQIFTTKLLEYAKLFQNTGNTIPILSLRRMLRISRQLLSSKEYSLEQIIHQQLLLDMFPESDKELLPLNFRNSLKLSNDLSQQHINKNDSSSLVSNHKDVINTSLLEISEDKLRIGSVTIPRYELRSNPELIPSVSFSPMTDHLLFMEKIMNVMFNAKEKHVLIIGSQGVGKNRIIDGFLQMLRAERYYMQLHRDSTVGSLSVTPELDQGMIVWKDSPLIKAAIEGKWIILDEVDKAPLEVVILLKSLLADGMLPLPDGRNLGSKATPIHPEFRSFVLANRPGFPFLGNDFFRACGDIFSSFILNNPSIESELLLLQREAPNVSIPILQKLASLFADLRALSTKGILPYPFSMRELLHVVRHVNRFGRVDDALKSIFAFDVWNATALKHIKHSLQMHEFPIDSIFSDNYIDDISGGLINIQKAEILPDPVVVGTRSNYKVPSKVSFSKWQAMKSEDTSLNPYITSPLSSFEYTRTKQFSEIILALKLNLPKKSMISSSAATLVIESTASSSTTNNHKSADELCLTAEHPDSIHIYQINTNNWECKKRVLDIHSRPLPRYNLFTKTSIPDEKQAFINGSIVKSLSTRCVYDRYNQCHVWIPFHCILISLPISNKDHDHEGTIINMSEYLNSNSIEKGSVQLIGCTHNGSMIFISFATGEILQLVHTHNISKDSNSANKLSNKSKIRILTPPTKSAIESTFIDQNKIGVVYEYNPLLIVWIDLTANESEDRNIIHMEQVNIMSLNQKIENALQVQPCIQSSDITMQAIDSSSNYALLYNQNKKQLMKLERSSIDNINHSTAATTSLVSLAGGNCNYNKLVGVVDDHINTSSGWVINCKKDEIELIDTVSPATRRVIKPKYCENIEPISAIALPITRVSQGSKVAITYANGSINIIEPSIISLQKSLQEYKDLRGILPPSDPNTHKHASGQPKHGQEDNKEHHGGNTWAGGTGGADTAGLGGVGGPYRLDKGFQVHQVDESLKQILSPETKAAIRAMAKEALARRLEQIGMTALDWNKYIELKARVQDEIISLKQVLGNMKSSHSERIWKTSTEGELDGNRIIDALAGERMVYRKRVKKEPKIGEKQILPKRISILLDISASMYRFDNVDGRLQRMCEVALMLMESFAETSSNMNGDIKYDYELRGHAGDNANIILIKFNEPPRNEKERYQIIQRICTYAQYCEAGDTTLQAVKYACDSVASIGVADDRLVLAFSDANLERYGITPTQLNEAIMYRQTSDKINTHIVFIASFGDQAIQLVNGVIPGHATVATDLKKLPHIIKEFMIATLNH